MSEVGQSAGLFMFRTDVRPTKKTVGKKQKKKTRRVYIVRRKEKKERKTMRSASTYIYISSCYWLARLRNRQQQQQQQKSMVNDSVILFFLSIPILCSRLLLLFGLCRHSPVEYSMVERRREREKTLFFRSKDVNLLQVWRSIVLGRR